MFSTKMSRPRVKTPAAVGKDAAASPRTTAYRIDARENVEDSSRSRLRARVGPSVADGLAMDLHRLVHRVRSEFNEMPGLQLTLPQAARLWGLDQEASRLVIDALVEGSFLRWTARGTIVRVDRAAA
jgi:hypothetical protein